MDFECILWGHIWSQSHMMDDKALEGLRKRSLSHTRSHSKITDAVQDVSYEEAKKAWDLSHPEPINVWLDRVTLPASFTNTSRPSIFVEFLNDKVSAGAH